MTVEQFNHLRSLYRWDTLKVLFPHAICFRAGVILITNGRVLTVRENATPERIGPPKGLAEKSDFSAFDTAVRELLEETGVDITQHNVDFSKATITIVNQHQTTEVFIYFIARVDTPPVVNIQKSEICSYDYVDIAKLSEFDASYTNARAFKVLQNLDHYVNI